MKRMKKKTLLLPLLVLLAACSNVKRELGVGRNSPDEFTVVKRAPLTLPPDFTLRPPADGSAPSGAYSSEQARAAVLGEGAPAPAKSGAEAALLSKMGADNPNPAVRAEIERENGYLALQNRSVADKLIFWKDGEPDPAKAPAPVVDAKAEKERLEKNKQEGKPANTGDVPVIDKKKGTIDRLF